LLGESRELGELDTAHRAGAGYAASLMPQTSCHASKGASRSWGAGYSQPFEAQAQPCAEVALRVCSRAPGEAGAIQPVEVRSG
jgi:hypothetical protein